MLTMTTYFVSDLHLTEEKPHITAGFVKFLTETSADADAVYVLGDLFEYWIGDDAADLLGVGPILEAMHARASQTPCYFIAGNRDFLVRSEFAKASGFSILADETVVDLYGTPTLLLHGDSLCTDDIAHQEFRAQMVNNTKWCDEFLSQDLPQRIEMAKAARQQSHQHKSEISMEIMDVSESAVLNAFTQHGVSHMIHGHTHRQNVHHYDLESGLATRTVLGDWGDTDSILRLTAEDSRLENTALM